MGWIKFWIMLSETSVITVLLQIIVNFDVFTLGLFVPVKKPFCYNLLFLFSLTDAFHKSEATDWNSLTGMIAINIPCLVLNSTGTSTLSSFGITELAYFVRMLVSVVLFVKVIPDSGNLIALVQT